MFNTMMGKYLVCDSKLHKMNAVSKMLCLVIFVSMLFTNDIILLSLLTVLTIGMVIFSNVPLKTYLKNASSLKILIIFLILITYFLGGSWYGTIISIVKIVLGILYTMVITYTTTKGEIAYGIEKILLPLSLIKIPVRKISLVLTLALRFIPTIFEQANKILKSQASRGIDFRHSSLKGKVIAISSMIVPLFLLTSKASDDVALAMEVKMYNPDAKRTNYRIYKWNRIDENMILLHIALFTFFISRMIIL